MVKPTEEKRTAKFTLRDKIKAKRQLRDTSLNTYINSLKVLKKQLIPDYDKSEPLMNADFLEDYEKVMEKINEEKRITTKKNRLTAVIVALTSDNKKADIIGKYSDKLKELSDKYLSFLRTQQKTDTQEKNWITYKELVEIVNKLMRKVKEYGIHKKDPLKDKLTAKEFTTLQRYVVLRTYLTFSLRNDFANMKVLKRAEYKKLPRKEKEENNFLILAPSNRKYFYINQYKNKRYLGEKVLEIPSKLNKVINLWLKWNKSGWYLLRTDRKTPLSPNAITKFLNSLFNKYAEGKKISSSMIRHIIISHLLKEEPTYTKRKKKRKILRICFFIRRGLMKCIEKLIMLMKILTRIMKTNQKRNH
jgi:hypothetical protein